ncbi:MAG: autotransporter domain-containing protein [Verrucomicrobia bacterium]|nr:autotransporter domain-containing protein [Verrucomicrobiota bacterium]
MQFSDPSLANFRLSKRWLFGMSVLLLGASTLYGQDSWQGSSGSWFSGSDWSSGVPNSETNAIIDNGTTVQIGPGPDGEQAFANSLTIGETTAGSTLQMLSGGVLRLNDPVTIGTGGTILFSGGTIYTPGFVDNGAIIFQVAENEFLSSPVSGTGELVMNIVGTLSVSGAGTYSGATILMSGTFQAESTGIFSPNSAFMLNSASTLDLNGFNNTIGSLAGTGTVINSGSANAILTVGSNNTSTVFSGVIEDGTTATLGLTKVGTGTLTLAGADTYSGPTQVIGGRLQAGVVGAFSPNSAFTVNSTLDLNGFNNAVGSLAGTGTVINSGSANAILTVGNNGTSTVFSGAIEDGTTATLGLTKVGTGTLTLAGADTYSGPTQVIGGTLRAGVAGAFSSTSAFTVNSTLDLNGFNNTIGSLSGTGTVVNSGPANATLTVGNDDSSTVFSGLIEDGTTATLGLTKVGTGTLTLSGADTYTGPTTVNAGTLVVNGSIASAETFVNPGGVLTGIGSIRGSVVNNGIVIPGNPTGTLTISGNYVQNSNGTLRISVGGTAPGQFGVLAVGGHATLAGTLQIVSINGFQLAVGNKLTFLTATGGVSGTFSTIQNPFPSSTAVEAQFLLLPDAVEIEGTQGSFVSILQSLGPIVTPNELAVAKALDSARGDPREAALFAFLDSQPIANLPHDLSLIAPTQISSINASVSIGKVQISNIGQRMANIHAGSTGFSSSGFTLNGEGPTFGNGLTGETGAEGKSGPSVLAPIPENRWGFFVTGLGEFTNVDSTPNANGYDVNTGGITLGVDYRVTPYFAVGLLGGYAHNNVSLVGGGNIDVNGGTFGAYATLFGDGFYLDAAVTGGPNGYDTHRTALQGSANGSTEGADINVVVSAGYDWKSGNFSIGPTASFEFGYVGLDGFSETGSLAPLKFPDQNTESETTAFGAKATYEWKIGKITLVPQVSAAWQHEYGSVAYQVIAGFASGAGTSFTVNGPEIGRDSLLIGAGVSMIWSDRISTYVFYDGDIARTNYDSHTVTGGFRITF